MIGRVVALESNLPISHARVTCEPTGKEFDRKTTETFTAYDGRFDIEVPVDGLRFLRVRGDGFGSAWFRLGSLPWPVAPLEHTFPLYPR